MEQKERLGAILRALAITELEYSLSGGGDSGESTLERVRYQDGPDRTYLPEIPIFITDTGQLRHLSELLYSIVADAPDGDWVNNEGGYGTVYVRPFEDDVDLAIECDMTFRDDGDYGDDDEEDFVDEDLEDEAFVESDRLVPVIVTGEVAP